MSRLYRDSIHGDHGTHAPAMPAAGRSTATARLSVHRKAAPEAAEADTGPDPTAGLLRDANGVRADAADHLDALGGGGQGLPPDLRGSFEQSLGVDLAGVRVHTGDASAQAADALGARAFAQGNDIHFGAGQYNPGDPFGQHLIAHEVAHTVQQQGAPTAGPQMKLEVSSPSDPAELEADHAADAMIQPMHNPLLDGLQPTGPAVPKTALEDAGGKEVNWDGVSPAMIDVVDEWHGKPTRATTPLGGLLTSNVPDVHAVSWWQFGEDWTTAQARWGTALKLMTEYKTAAADASAKGMIEDPTGEGLDAEAEGAVQVGTSTAVGKAFDASGQVATAEPWTGKGLERKDALELASARKAIRKAELEIESKRDQFQIKRNGLTDKTLNLRGAHLDREQLDIEGMGDGWELTIKNLEKERDGVVASVETVEKLLGAATKDNKAEGVLEAVKVVGLGINSAHFKKEIDAAEQQARLLRSKVAGIKKSKADLAIESAALGVATALLELKAALREVDAAVEARAEAYTALATAAGAAASKGKMGEADVGKLTAAIQAVPLMEHVRDLTGRIGASITTPHYEKLSGQGCAQATPKDQTSMRGHVTGLKGLKADMTKQHDKWAKRVISVEKLIGKLGKVPAAT